MHPKYHTILLGLMLIITGSVSAINTIPTQTLSKGDILYVGGSGPGNYSVIQYAINDAPPYATIYIFPGNYTKYFTENKSCIYIQKPLTLEGANRTTTILEGRYGRGSIIRIQSNHVTIHNLTLTCINGFNDGYTAIYARPPATKSTVENIHIYNNIITHNYRGFEFYSVRNSRINNNIISNNWPNGFDISIDNCIIENNIISNNAKGILASSCGNYPNLIQYNHFESNGHAIESTNFWCTVQNNNFINNTKKVDFRRYLFYFELQKLHPALQNFNQNYWNNWKFKNLPKPIISLSAIYLFSPFQFIPFPYVKFDLYPAHEPYEIGGFT